MNKASFSVLRCASCGKIIKAEKIPPNSSFLWDCDSCGSVNAFFVGEKIIDAENLEKVFDAQIKRCKDVLVVKSKEYATQDCLHNFKIAAALEGMTIKQALAGMMAKHTVSVYDMCVDNQTHPVEKWDEKITDHINYLILLRAIVESES